MTKLLMRALAGLVPAAVLLATPALAAGTPPRPAAAATVPDQPWYPPGYRDLRIAAAETMRIFPRDPRSILTDFGDRGDHSFKTYDVIDCNLGYDLPDNPDWRAAQRALLALDIARMRTELAKLGYAPKVYDAALLAHERAALTQIRQATPPPPVNSASDAAASDEPAAAETEDAYDATFWGHAALAKRMEAQRKRLQPNKPRIIMEGGCGGGEGEFTVALAPANGRLWLVNAFAFKVCERKRPDAWDHRACGWNEYASGDKTIASGRYMYEARWPDGMVRRGAKILDETADGGAIVIRRN